MPHTAELIAVGTELLLGSIANTDAQMLSRELSALGIHVYYHTVVGDNPQRLRAAVELAHSRADLILTTGGLGPTCDDLTKTVLAQCFGKSLVYNAKAKERCRAFFRSIGREMTANNRQQFYLPEGATVFQNDWGTAPGCAFEADGVHVLMLPGPPRECAAMFRHRARPYLQSLSDGAILSRTLKLFGIGESGMEDQLRDKMNAMTNPTLAPYAKEGECELRITAKAPTEAAARALIAPGGGGSAGAGRGQDLRRGRVLLWRRWSWTCSGPGPSRWAAPELHRRPHRQAHDRPARRVRRVLRRRGQLYQCGKARRSGGAGGTAGAVRRGVRSGGPGHGPGGPAGAGL